MDPCKACGAPIEKRTKHRKVFCSRKCQNNHFNQFYQPSKWRRSNISKGTVGAISELIVSKDLLARGIPVFRALSPSCPGDLCIILNGATKIVEVTTGYRYSVSNKLIYPAHKKHKYDFLAVVVDGEDIVYVPELNLHA